MFLNVEKKANIFLMLVWMRLCEAWTVYAYKPARVEMCSWFAIHKKIEF